METGEHHQEVTYTVTQGVVPKTESLHYLIVDDGMFCAWKSLAHRLSLPTDSLVADFLLQHYNKTSALTLTQCVQCNGSLTQYCVQCNIYIGQPHQALTSLGDIERSSCSLEELCGVGSTATGGQIILNVTEAVGDPSVNAVCSEICEDDGEEDDSVTELVMPPVSQSSAALVQITSSAAARDEDNSLSQSHVFTTGSSPVSTKPEFSATTVSDVGVVLKVTDTNKTVTDPVLVLKVTDTNKTVTDPVLVLKVTDTNKTVTDPVLPTSSQLVEGDLQSHTDTTTVESCDKVPRSEDLGSARENQAQNCTAANVQLPLPRKVRTRAQKDSSRTLADSIIIVTDEAKPRRVQTLTQPHLSVRQAAKQQASSSPQGDLAAKVKVIMAEESAGEAESSQAWSSPVKLKNEANVGKRKKKEALTCEVCGKQIWSKYELEGHLRIHSGERPYACPQCPARYTRSYHLTCHLKTHDPVKPFPCPQCPKQYVRAWDLKEHQTSHLEVRPHVCETCGFASKSETNLKHHKRVHVKTTNKTYVCAQCGAGFRWRSNFVNHVRIHTDERAFACPHCPMKYAQSGSLKKHLQRKHVANRPRPFVCEICGAARYEKCQFEKHMRIHTGEKPYKCCVCGAAFIQDNALKGHMKIHTETAGKNNWCSLCGAAFKRFASIKTHIRKVHKDVSEFSIQTVEIQIQ